MANVKHTTNNGEILTTNCKKVATALKRFAEYLSTYDNIYNDLLSQLNNDNNTTTFTDDRYNTITITLTVNDSNDNYTLTIKHTHNAPKTIWCICNQDGSIKDFTDRKDLFEYAYKNKLYGDFETIWIEEKELKDDRFDYYETVDYEELDLYKIRTMLELDICDMKITNDNETATDTKDTESDTKDTESDTNDTNKETSTDNITPQIYKIKAYYDGKEITVPYSEYKCRKYAVEYIHNLYINRVVPYETLFMIYYDKHVETITIEMVFDTPDLLQYNVDDINVGLKTDWYKKVREGVERLCTLIDDNHVCVVGFKYTKHTCDYAITKSKYPDSYNFRRGNNNRIQKPSDFARFLYYHTFAHEVILKYWHTI